MKKEPLFVALSNQKGGVGKSTFTVLLASYFHYLKGYNVLVVDCDYPQHSISTMRNWEVGNIEKNVHLQNQLVEQFGASGRKAYSILNSTPEEARETAGRFLEKSELDYDLVLFDLPGTVNVPGVFQSVINMDYVFTPITQERMAMRSSMSFVLAIREYMHRHKDVPLRGIHMFWNRMDKRVSKDLYNGYTEIFRSLKLPVLETVIPSAERYKKRLRNERASVPQHFVPSIFLRNERKQSGPAGSGNRNHTETSIKTIMTTKRRTDYQVDEEALKRMMAGDVTALERTVPPEEEPETKSQAGPCPEKQEKKSGSSRQQIKKTPDGAADSDEYRSRFLKVKRKHSINSPFHSKNVILLL